MENTSIVIVYEDECGGIRVEYLAVAEDNKADDCVRHIVNHRQVPYQDPSPVAGWRWSGLHKMATLYWQGQSTVL